MWDGGMGSNGPRADPSEMITLGVPLEQRLLGPASRPAAMSRPRSRAFDYAPKRALVSPDVHASRKAW
eukprot:12798167-Alexandrium_andersonii.AAC.1